VYFPRSHKTLARPKKGHRILGKGEGLYEYHKGMSREDTFMEGQVSYHTGLSLPNTLAKPQKYII
jgi:hypothetical protein